MRLNAYLARAGVASRRGAEELIRAERVRVNGELAQLATRVADGDRVELDGSEVLPEPLVYVLLNKPAGVVTTARDPQGRPTVVDLVGQGSRLFPVGRLDADTTGALLLTNDGLLANRLAGLAELAQEAVQGPHESIGTERRGQPVDGGLGAPIVIGLDRSRELVARAGGRWCEVLGTRSRRDTSEGEAGRLGCGETVGQVLDHRLHALDVTIRVQAEAPGRS